MRAAIYMRVGNPEQPDTETDVKKKEQELKDFCERKKHQIAGDYFPGKDRRKAICFLYAQMGDTVEIEKQKTQIEEYCREHGLSLSCVYERNNRDLRDRKAFFQMVAKAHKSQDIVFIVPSVGGISTQYKEFHDIIEILKENGISVVSLNPADRMILDADNSMCKVEEHACHRTTRL